MKKVLLFVLMCLLLVGCGKKEETDPLLNLGYKFEENKYVSGNVVLTKENNESYGTTDVIIEEVITSNPNTTLFVNSIKYFIDIDEKIIKDGLELLVDAYNENEKSSQIDIYNENKYYLQLYITNEKKVMAVILTPRVKGRVKDGKYLLNDDLGFDHRYSAARRSSNVEKNTSYDEYVLKTLFNLETPVDVVKKISTDALKNCNPEEICENSFDSDYEIDILAKNGVYSTYYELDNKSNGVYYRTIHSIDTYKDDLTNDFEILSNTSNEDVRAYKDTIINKIEKKDYKLKEDGNHIGKHYLMNLDRDNNFKVEIDIYEKYITFDYAIFE